MRIDRIDRGLKLARIEATHRARLFEVKTDNLSAFSLLLGPPLLPAGMPLELKVNGEAVWRGVPPAPTLSLDKGPSGRWVQKPWVGPAVGPPDHAEAAHALMPGSRLEIFEETGHFPQLDDPFRFAGILREFLEETEAAEFDFTDEDFDAMRERMLARSRGE